MPLRSEDLPAHPDGENVNNVDPEAVDYRTISKWRDRYCGNCGWFLQRNVSDAPDIAGDEHPEADGKGPIHRCGIVGGGIAFGGFCSLWGTIPKAEETNQARDNTEQKSLKAIFKDLETKVNY